MQPQEKTVVEIPEVKAIQFMPVCLIVNHGPVMLSRICNVYSINTTDQELIDWYIKDLQKENHFTMPLINPSVIRGPVIVMIGQSLEGYSTNGQGIIESMNQYINPLRIAVVSDDQNE